MDLDELRRNWTAFGEKDPFWAILTDPRGKDGQWNLDQFFANGRSDIAATLERLTELGQATSGDRCLDFGCGVGRLTHALADHYREAVGVDIASTMIEHANTLNQDGDRCRFVVNERDDLSLFDDESFDLVYTMLVLQHMRPEYSTRYLREFVRILRPGGTAVFQMPVGPLTADELAAQRLEAAGYRAILSTDPLPTLRPGEDRTISVTVTNAGSETWPAVATSMPPIRLGNRWLNRHGAVVIADDGRSHLPHDLPPGQSVEVELTITPPREFDVRRLRLDLIHETIGWFADLGSTPVDLPVDISLSWRSMVPNVRDSRPAARARAAFGRQRPAEPDEPVMEMHAVPEEEVRRIVGAAGGRVLAVDANWYCSYPWHSRTFFVTR